MNTTSPCSNFLSPIDTFTPLWDSDSIMSLVTWAHHRSDIMGQTGWEEGRGGNAKQGELAGVPLVSGSVLDWTDGSWGSFWAPEPNYPAQV